MDALLQGKEEAGKKKEVDEVGGPTPRGTPIHATAPVEEPGALLLECRRRGGTPWIHPIVAGA